MTRILLSKVLFLDCRIIQIELSSYQQLPLFSAGCVCHVDKYKAKVVRYFKGFTGMNTLILNLLSRNQDKGCLCELVRSGFMFRNGLEYSENRKKIEQCFLI